jgi:hypothetical protein
MLTSIISVVFIVGFSAFLIFIVKSMGPSDPNFRENSEEREYYARQGWAYPWSSKAERIRSQGEQQRVADEEARLRYESLQYFKRQNRNQND